MAQDPVCGIGVDVFATHAHRLLTEHDTERQTTLPKAGLPPIQLGAISNEPYY